MSEFMGFSNWFLIGTIILGLIFNYTFFRLKRYEIACWLCILWLFLLVIEAYHEKRTFENWKRQVFQ
jgi:hypothetical protein